MFLSGIQRFVDGRFTTWIPAFAGMTTMPIFSQRLTSPSPRLEESGYEPNDRVAAFQKALEWGDRIPLGVIYQTRLPTYEEQVAGLKRGPVATRELKKLSAAEIEGLRAEFM
jgi:hypothetical protein